MCFYMCLQMGDMGAPCGGGDGDLKEPHSDDSDFDDNSLPDLEESSARLKLLWATNQVRTHSWQWESLLVVISSC